MIGRLRKIPVSEMYEAGGSNFTTWLQENIDVLNEVIDLSLSGVRRTVSLSAAELVARDKWGGTVVIENEPEGSSDGGLGRLLTSLASVQARTGIWIVADSRAEHVAAVSWLNETSQASFYLLKVEAFRIDNSLPAPMMTLISGPQQGGAEPSPEEAPAIGETPDITGFSVAAGAPVPEEAGTTLDPEAIGDAPPASEPTEPITEEASLTVPADALGIAAEEEEEAPIGRDITGLVLYQFWTELLEKANQRTRIHAGIEPRRETVIGTNAGIAGLDYNYIVRERDASVELRIDRGEDRRNENDTAFNALQATADAIAYNFGGPLQWRQDEDSGAKHIEHRIETGGYRDEELWPEIQDAMIDAMIRLERAMKPHISSLQL